MTPDKYICALTDAAHVANCGGKAAQLAQLLRSGLPVPPGFVVTAAVLTDFLDHNGLAETADELSRRLSIDDEHHLLATADKLRQRVLAGELPVNLRETLDRWRTRLRLEATVIVRSSAVGEDGANASFAGQLESILDVEAQTLDSALRACWASYWSRRVLLYQRSRGLRLEGMGVIVQEQVRPVFAGVLFTAAPGATGGAADDLLVEYCRGHGEDLVQGRIDPGRVVISRGDFSARHLARLADHASPNDAPFHELARTGLAVEALFGRPQDIEWAQDDQKRLWLVQSRPITTDCGMKEAREHVQWSNANVNENYPEPISPLLYSIAQTSYYHYFRNLGLAFGISPARVAAAEQPLRHIIGVHGARMYYNLTNIYSVLRAAPFGEQLAAYFSAFTGAEALAAPRRQLAGRRAWIEAAVIGFRAVRLFRRLPKRVAEFERMVGDFAARTTPELLSDASLSELLDAFRGFTEIRFHRWTPAGLADAAAMISYGLLKHLLGREFPEAEQSALHNTLLKGLTDLVSGQPMIELWRLSRMIRVDAAVAECFARLDNDAQLDKQVHGELTGFRAALAEYLRRWGFRRSGELMLTMPDFQEQPGPLLDILRVYAAQEGESPEQRLLQQLAQRTAETRRVLSVLCGRRIWRYLPWPSKASVVRLVLRWCQSAIGLRERVRMRQALLYTRCRAIVLAIGRQLTANRTFERPEDVFFLTYQELVDLLSGSAMFPHHVRELVSLRRTTHVELSAHKPPDRLSLPHGAYWARGVIPESSEAAASSAAMTGVGACGGSFTGPAKVLTDVMDCGRLARGDVLVTRQTDPGWGPAFLLIRGLVLERGGMLSHGAILAREYGIPTVVGVRDAVARIQTGQLLHVDGDRGVVQQIDR